MSTTAARILSDADLAGLGITARDVATQIETAIKEEAARNILTTPKSAIVRPDGRYLMTTFATSDAPRMTVVKSVIVSPRNPARGLAGIEGNIMIQDAETGLLLAVMGAKWITAVRTAGLSAVAALRLADPASRSIAFVGCGAQARSHLDAFAELFPLTEVRAFGRSRSGIDGFCDYAKAKGLQARGYTDAQPTLAGADIVVSSITLSYDVAPFLDAGWLKPGAFAAITDLALPWKPQPMTAFKTLFIDDTHQEATSPKPMVAPDLITGDLKDLVTGARSAAFNPERCSAFAFRGLAIGDFAVATHSYQKAVAVGVGTDVAL